MTEDDEPLPSAPPDLSGDPDLTLPPEPHEGSAPRGEVRSGGELRPGTVLGTYRLLEILGAGAMGIVYLAEHLKLGRRVAIKTLRSEYSGNPRQLSRFFAEARSVNRIAHENIIEVTDFVESTDGPSYYVMELLRGATLERALARETAFPPERAVAIALQVCAAMEAVHAAGIVHRDLKPENLFLIERGGRRDFVKLLDFGIAKLADAEQAGVKRTGSGAMLGTPQYMSPEQATGKPADRRADVYALGVMLYEMLTGHPPFEARTIGEVILKHLGEVPPPPSRAKGLVQPIPPALDVIVLRCLEKSPGSRFQTMADVAAALREAQQSQGWELTPQPLRAAPPRGSLRRRAAGAAAAGALLALAAGAWVAFHGDDSTSTPPAPSAEAPATKVRLSFESTPSGAAVVRLSDGSRAGTTPLVLEVDRADEVAEFELRLPGHLPLRRAVSLHENGSVAAMLAAGPAASAPAATAAPAAARSSKPSRTSTRKTAAPLPKGGTGKPSTPDPGATLNPF